MTSKASILRKQPPEKLEVKLAKLGIGQIFGELGPTIRNLTINDDQQIRALGMMAQNTFRRERQIKLICTSEDGHILKIDASNFMKKVMSIPKIRL